MWRENASWPRKPGGRSKHYRDKNYAIVLGSGPQNSGMGPAGFISAGAGQNPLVKRCSCSAMTAELRTQMAREPRTHLPRV